MKKCVNIGIMGWCTDFDMEIISNLMNDYTEMLSKILAKIMKNTKTKPEDYVMCSQTWPRDVLLTLKMVLPYDKTYEGTIIMVARNFIIITKDYYIEEEYFRFNLVPTITLTTRMINLLKVL